MARADRFHALLTLSAALAASLAAQAPGQAPARTGLRIVVVEGEGAINNIREQRAKEPVVRVTDAEFHPVAGASVTFVTTELGASASFPSGNTLSTTSDAKGEVVGRGLRPNNVAGPFQIRVTATYRGQTATAVVNQTNAAPLGAVRKGGSKKGLIALIVGGGAAAGVSLALANKKSTPASQPTPPASPSASITAGAGSFGKP